MREAQPIVKGFRGEERNSGEPLLEDRVSPDALNVDYGRGTLRRRGGFVKLHSEAVKEGGVRVANAAGARRIQVRSSTTFDLSSEFTFEVFVVVHSYSGAGVIACKRPASLTSGWSLDFTGGAFVFSVVDSGGTARVATSAAFALGKRYHVVGRKSAAGVVDISVNGTVVTGATGSGYTNNTEAISFGGLSYTAQTSDMTVDDARIWSVYRTNAQVLATSLRELIESEVDDTTLLGYWPMNDGKWNGVYDGSLNRNSGVFVDGGVSFVRGLVPSQGLEGFAGQFDGLDDYGSAPYHAAYAPILDTGNVWTIEGWFRLDNANYDVSAGAAWILHFGSFNTGKGSVVGLALASTGDRSLTVLYSTTTTHANASADTTYDMMPGVPVHIAVTRNGATLTVYINGESVYSTAGVTTENGPTSSTSYGMFFGGRNSAGSWDANRFTPVTMDEIRLWKVARSSEQIAMWKDRTFADTKHADLVGYWRFDAGDKEKDETGRSAIVFKADGSRPVWSRGLTYPRNPRRMTLLAPLNMPVRADEVLAGANAFSREMLVGTHTDFWSLIGDMPRHLLPYTSPGDTSPWGWAHFQSRLILCNGLEANMKYDGAEAPTALTIAQPAAACSAAVGAAGLITGTVLYRVAFRNSRDGTESLASAASGSAAPSTQKVDLTSIPVSTDAQVNQRRIYRSDGGGSYRYLADINDNTTTTYTDNTAYGLVTEVINDRRSNPAPHRHCVVWGNSVFLLNSAAAPSGITYSDADSINFASGNTLYVDRGDGDELMGGYATIDGLVLFKQRSMHLLTGDGPTTYQLRKIGNRGTVSGQTVRNGYFLSYDGVYRVEDPDTMIGLDQGDVFGAMDPERYRYANAVHDAVNGRYVVSVDTRETLRQAYYDVFPSLYTSYWKLEADGVDSTGARTLTASGTPTYQTDGALGKCVDLNGSSQYFSGTGVVSYPTTITFGGWFRFDSRPGATGSPMMVAVLEDSGNVARWQLYYHKYGYLSAAFDHVLAGGATTGLYAIPLNTWVHVVFTVSGSTTKIYVNGVLYAVRVFSIGSTTGSGTGTILIGKEKTTGTSIKFDGRMKRVFYCDGTALAESQIQEIYQYESAMGYAKRARVSMAYDEAADAWSKWDCAFDAMCEAAHSSARAEVLGARNGFVYRLNEGDSDGADVVSGGTRTDSGSLTAVSGATIADAAAAFPTDGDGVAGVKLLARPTSGSDQERLIIGNDGTNLYLDKGLSPAVTGTYYVAPIVWYWESRWMDMGAREWVKRWFYFQAWVKETAPTATVTLKYKTEAFETWVSTSFTTADEFSRLVLNARGRGLKVRFEALLANVGVEIEGFLTEFGLKRSV